MATEMCTANDLLQFYPQANGDGLNITWAHAVNSRDELSQALNGDAMMLETDIIVRGFGTHNPTSIPVHAHPPATDSDICTEQWIQQVIKVPNKGIKLDFKCLQAVLPTLEILNQNKDKICVPIVLNADIFVGPNSSIDPIPANDFIEICTANFPLASLSLGFWTAWIAGTTSTYTWDMILDALYKVHNLRQPVTFPIRAVFLSTSWELFVFLLGVRPSFSITVWSHASDDVDIDGLVKLREQGGKDRVYFDLPEQQMACLKTSISADDSDLKKPNEWDPDLWCIEDAKSGLEDNLTVLGSSGVVFLSKDSSKLESDSVNSKQLFDFIMTQTHPLTISGKLQWVENQDEESQFIVKAICYDISTTTKIVPVVELRISSCGKVRLQNLTTNVSVETNVPISDSYEFSLFNVGSFLKPTVMVSPRHDGDNHGELHTGVEVELSENIVVGNSAELKLGVSFCKVGTSHDIVVQDMAVHVSKEHTETHIYQV